MNVYLTRWAVDSYLSLRHANVFTRAFYWETLRPDIELLANYPDHPKFSLARFWGPFDVGGGRRGHGHKMKWRQVGPGHVQLRLAVYIAGQDAYLCEGYVKTNAKLDERKRLVFLRHAELIDRSQHGELASIL